MTDSRNRIGVVLERFKTESEGLARSWQRHDSVHLRDYLVRGVEDPRINVQSILTRHFLIERLVGDRFSALADAELRFAIVMNWLTGTVSACRGAEQLGEILDVLLDGFRATDDIEIPDYVRSTFEALPCELEGAVVANYINEVLMWPPFEPVGPSLPASVLNTFTAIWKHVLEGAPGRRVSVVEPACGSANDYRFLHAFGIAGLIDYHGFDICEKNVANARMMFGNVSFACGNALAVDRPDKSFDLCFVHDLFEHLSPAAFERAMEEIIRITRTACCLSFFNACNGPEHFERAIEDYHWNTLSMPRTEALLREMGCEVEIIGIDAMLRRRFGCADTHNKQAYTVMATIKN
jgi:SAM-dependent methyltransferase